MDGSDGVAEDWGPFGRPIFDDPSSRALSRVGVVDVGSNSVRMVIFDGAARSPAYFYNEKVMCALGAGLGETGRLNPSGRIRALSALKRFQSIATGMQLAPLTAVATAAVRDASDGPEFKELVERETGLKLYVIDGEEEARLSAQGVLLGWPEASGIVCDIGGSSMELALVENGDVGKRATFDLGPLKLLNVKGGKSGRNRRIRERMATILEQFGDGHKRLYLVGGSWRAIARLDMERRSYPLHVLHEYRMTPKELRKTISWINDNELADLEARTGTSSARMSLVPVAGEVLKELVKTLKPREIATSSYGIREGMLYEQMPEQLKRRDPLIESCRYSEKKDARFPGYGRSLYRFVEPLFKSSDFSRKRLLRAACLLHDVTWRAHPDFRAEVCFDNATRANLGGLNHRERIWLGLALLHRYKNSRAGTRFEDVINLLSDKDIREAEVAGKAMRFGAMFMVSSPDTLATLNWKPRKRVLRVSLSETGKELFGEVAENRLKSLTNSLDAVSEVKDR